MRLTKLGWETLRRQHYEQLEEMGVIPTKKESIENVFNKLSTNQIKGDFDDLFFLIQKKTGRYLDEDDRAFILRLRKSY